MTNTTQTSAPRSSLPMHLFGTNAKGQTTMETNPDWLRALYQEIKRGELTIEDASPVAINDAIEWLKAADCRAKARAAFEALGLPKFETCLHCHGDGVSRGTDRGMACGCCHGRGCVSTDSNKRLLEHRRQLARRGRTSMM